MSKLRAYGRKAVKVRDTKDEATRKNAFLEQVAELTLAVSSSSVVNTETTYCDAVVGGEGEE